MEEENMSKILDVDIKMNNPKQAPAPKHCCGTQEQNPHLNTKKKVSKKARRSKKVASKRSTESSVVLSIKEKKGAKGKINLQNDGKRRGAWRVVEKHLLLGSSESTADHSPGRGDLFYSDPTRTTGAKNPGDFPVDKIIGVRRPRGMTANLVCEHQEDARQLYEEIFVREIYTNPEQQTARYPQFLLGKQKPPKYDPCRSSCKRVDWYQEQITPDVCFDNTLPRSQEDAWWAERFEQKFDEPLRLSKNLLRPHPEVGTVVDVGAHIGLFTVWAATYLRANKVIAIEPVPINVQALEENVKRLEPQLAEKVRVLPFQAVGGKKTEKLTLYWPEEKPSEATRHPREQAEIASETELERQRYYGEETERTSFGVVAQEKEDDLVAGMSIIPHDEEKDEADLEIPGKKMDSLCTISTTLSHLLEEQKITDVIDLLKIDVEGDELAVLQGAPLKRVNNVVMEVFDTEFTGEIRHCSPDTRMPRIVALLNRNGFRVRWWRYKVGSVREGYLLVVPKTAGLWILQASRSRPV
ncbi:unnamed protein product [Amoebophrya sp. A120]|nr:unnamed protein product [Amoebophrya sp. A120]|eukprot:GSA120T00024182001.1